MRLILSYSTHSFTHQKGALICPETGRRFSITGGAPNMMLEDAELS